MKKTLWMAGLCSLLMVGGSAQAQSSVTSQVSALRNSVKSFADASNTRMTSMEAKIAKMEACSNERKVYDAQNDECFSASSAGVYQETVNVKTVTTKDTHTFSTADSDGVFHVVSVSGSSTIPSAGTCSVVIGGKKYKLTSNLSQADMIGNDNSYSASRCDSDRTVSSARYTLYHGSDGYVYAQKEAEPAPRMQKLAKGWDGKIVCERYYYQHETCSGNSQGTKEAASFSSKAYKLLPIDF